MLRMTVRAFVAATVVATAGFAVMLSSPSACAQGLASDKAKKTPPPTEAARAPTGMALVEGGPFRNGTSQAEAQEIVRAYRMDKGGRARFEKFVAAELVDEKRREVDVPGFFMDRAECTNRQYYHFMMATGAAPPNLPADHRAGWRDGRLPGTSQLLFIDEVKSWPNLIQRLKSGAKGAASSQPIGRIWGLLDPKLRAKLNKVQPKKDLDPELPEAIVKAINAMLVRRDFYDPKFYRGIHIRGYLGREALALQNKGVDKLTEQELARLNRIYLDDTLRGCLDPGQSAEMMLFPVTGLTFFQAKACAEWMGKRLPTELEWEKSARGKQDTRWYPWGSKFGNEQVNFCNWALYWMSGLNKDMRPDGLCPVGSFPGGVTPYGMVDMIGNAIEMVDSTWAPYKNAVRGKGIVFDPPESESSCIIKGGGYGEQFKEHLRIPFRYPWRKGESSDAIGFRCAKDTHLGHTALGRIAGDLFQGMWDQRIIKLDTENGLAAMEKVRLDEQFADQAIITEYSWLGILNIRDHLYDSPKALRNASDKVRRKKRGHIFLGVLHTDVAFSNPRLSPGNYAIVYQKGFKALNTKKKAPAKKPDSAKKPTKKKTKKKDKKKDRGKSKKKGKSEKDDPKKVPEAKAADEKQAPKPDAIPEFAAVARILFVDAAGKPVAAIERPVIRTVNKKDVATLSITPAQEEQPATLTLHLAMLKKYEKRKFIVVDIPLVQPVPENALESYTE